MLLVSSELPEAPAMSDRLLAMYGGRIVAELPGGADEEAVMALITGVGVGVGAGASAGASAAVEAGAGAGAAV